MAIFDVNEELSRQAKVGAPDIVGKGEGAMWMKALGYNPTTGKENKWGSVLHAIPGMATYSNLGAGAISKGSDVNKVIKEGRDEAIGYDLNKVALGLDIFKMAATAGMGGAVGAGAGAGFSNGMAQTLMGGSPGLMQAGMAAGNAGNAISQSDLMNSGGTGMDSMGQYNKVMGTIGNAGGVSNSLARTIQGGMAYNNALDEGSALLHPPVNEPFSYL